MFTMVLLLLSQFSRLDSLHGSNTHERSWWDVNFYHLSVVLNIDDKSISGSNEIRYKVLHESQVMQIDLYEPLQINKVIQNNHELEFKREGNHYFITLKEKQKIDDVNALLVYYSGKPRVAPRAPWTGGFTWTKDANGHDFIATSCQGEGASLWWPNKDQMWDEVDSMAISITCPENLMDVSNGRLRSVQHHKDAKTKTWHWFVSNPINNYGVNINVGDYVEFSEIYQGENGNLDCNYYVLKDNIKKAKEHFKDVPRMLQAFEHWFGPYPFYSDGFKLVEVPYLGMEHQSSVTYGNQFKKGYLGNDLSDSGWGLKFDFIIIHESGHEWFANNITNKDNADMWIHEGFTAYSENLFLDYHYGKTASADYVIGTRKRIINDKAIIGPYGVWKRGSSDMYYKGANVLHMVRAMLNNDEKWRHILRKMNQVFYHSTVTTADIENFIQKESNLNLSGFFNQYLRDTRIPELQYRLKDGVLQYRFNQCVDDFTMTVNAQINKKIMRLVVNNAWQNGAKISQIDSFVINNDFYITVKKVDD